MALAAKQFGSSLANPQAVLASIGSRPVDLSDTDASSIFQIPHQGENPAVPLKIFQPEESTASTEQTRQLGQHLSRWREQLESQQATFDEERLHWILQCDQDHQQLDERDKVVEQRLRQVQSLERQLLQLQNDVIDGQTALREVAAKLSAEGFAEVSDPEKIAALEDLRFEISERFDYLVKRWDRFRAESA